MQFRSIPGPLSSLDTDWLAIGLFDGQTVPDDTPATELITALLSAGDFGCGLGETLPLFGALGQSRSILLYGLGRNNKFGPGPAFQAGVAIAKRLSSKPRKAVAILLPSADPGLCRPWPRGIVVGTEGPGIRKLENSRHAFESVAFLSSRGEPQPRDIEEGRLIGQAINLARELVNTPPRDKTPESFAREGGRTCRRNRDRVRGLG